MRHGIAGRKLNRVSSHRQALFMNLVQALVTHEQIKTTLPKAKTLRPIIEKYVTMAKNNQKSLHTRRVLMSRLHDATVVDKLLTTLATRYDKRPGGYVRVIKAGFRYGDAAPMGIIEFVDRDLAAKGGPDAPVVIDGDDTAEKAEKKAI